MKGFECQRKSKRERYIYIYIETDRHTNRDRANIVEARTADQHSDEARLAHNDLGPADEENEGANI